MTKTEKSNKKKSPSQHIHEELNSNGKQRGKMKTKTNRLHFSFTIFKEKIF